MSKFRFILVFFIVIVSSNISFSQKIFTEGFIVKNNGTFHEGLVLFNPGNNIPLKCIFKNFDIAVEVAFSPNDIQAFGYKNGRQYQSKNVKGTMSFLEILIKGDLTLLKGEKGYYVMGTDQRLIDLNDQTIIWQQNNFSGREDFLKFLAGNTVTEEKTGLESRLKSVVAAYNQKTGKNFLVINNIYSDKKVLKESVRYTETNARYGILGGINNYSLSLSLDEYVPKPEIETSFTVGLSYEKSILRKTDKLELRADILYLQQNFYSFTEKIEYNRFTRDDAFFDFKAVKVPLLLQYDITGLKMVPYVNGGISCMYLMNKNYLHINEAERTDKSVDTYEDSNMKFAATEFAAIAGAGLKIRIMNGFLLKFEGRFEYGSGIFKDSQFDNLKQHSVQPSLMVGIMF